VADPFEVLYVDEHESAGLVGPVLLLAVGGKASAAQLRRVRAWGQRITRENPQGGAFAIIVRGGTSVPTDPERTFIRSALEACGEFAVAGALVIEGDGFMSAALRGAVTAVTLAARLSFPFKVFGSLSSAAPFLLGKLANGSPTTLQLLNAAAALRRAQSGRGGLATGGEKRQGGQPGLGPGHTSKR
jgi:hypothetical protein